MKNVLKGFKKKKNPVILTISQPEVLWSVEVC